MAKGKMGNGNGNGARAKLCFVTIGATAAFNDLIHAILHDGFLNALEAEGYTDLRIQYGKDGASIFEEYEKYQRSKQDSTSKLSVTGFDFNKDGLNAEMLAAKGRGKQEGVVISHAGSGSILDALRIEVPLIVVPNTSLLDNHQVELAEELARQGYLIHGKIDELPAALREAASMRDKRKVWPPPVNAALDPSGKGLIGVMDDEMGFVD